MKLKLFNARIINKNEIIRTLSQNYENHEVLRILLQNNENHENLIIP